jgi:hypothetical protein
MATNLLAPNGLSFARNRLAGSNSLQAQKFKIKAGYASSIAMGDLVKTLTGGSQGYIGLSGVGDTSCLGVFAGVLLFYDSATQLNSHGLNGSWVASSSPNADVDCLVISDPYAAFIAQVSGGTYSTSWRGMNIDFLTATNGAPNASGRSVLALDFSTLATTNTLPFRIVGPAGVSGGPQDPENVNPWVEVRLNTAEELSATGI